MAQYLIRRLLIALAMLVVITFLVYVLIRSTPGDPTLVNLEGMSPDKPVDPAALERFRAQYYLDKPIPVGYAMWFTNLLKGDLGQSMAYNGAPVSQVIGERIGNTLILTVSSLLLAYMLSIPMGLYFTARNGTMQERGLSTVLYMLYSLPSYVAALFLQLALAVKLDLLPLFGTHSDNFNQLSFMGQVWDVAKHAILPVTCFTYTGLAYYSRFIKANMNEVIRQDFIRTAKAKGVAPRNIILHHAFRNTLIPLVTQIGLTLPALLGGSVILEQIFAWPGIGKLFFEALGYRDYPILMSLVLMFSVLTLLGQLLADVLYAVVDPRVSLT